MSEGHLPQEREGADPADLRPRPSNAPGTSTLAELGREVARARLKFPTNAHLLAALVEEVGALAQALLQRQGKELVQAEAIQVACVALRIVEEGDADFEDDGRRRFYCVSHLCLTVDTRCCDRARPVAPLRYLDGEASRG